MPISREPRMAASTASLIRGVAGFEDPEAPCTTPITASLAIPRASTPISVNAPMAPRTASWATWPARLPSPVELPSASWEAARTRSFQRPLLRSSPCAEPMSSVRTCRPILPSSIIGNPVSMSSPTGVGVPLACRHACIKPSYANQAHNAGQRSNKNQNTGQSTKE